MVGSGRRKEKNIQDIYQGNIVRKFRKYISEEYLESRWVGGWQWQWVPAGGNSHDYRHSQCQTPLNSTSTEHIKSYPILQRNSSLKKRILHKFFYKYTHLRVTCMNTDVHIKFDPEPGYFCPQGSAHLWGVDAAANHLFSAQG